jgi:hypothetical protein
VAYLVYQIQFGLKPQTSWEYMEGSSRLAPLAIRIFECISNSIPSERSFSSMNFIQNDIRNWLSIDNTDMLTFIFMSKRVLKKFTNIQVEGLGMFTDTQQLQYDEWFLQTMQDDVFRPIED